MKGFSRKQSTPFHRVTATGLIAGLFILGLLLVNGCNLLTGSTPQEQTSSQRNTVSSFDGVPLRYRALGTGSPAIVFVHGWLGNQSFWEAQMQALSQRCRVVSLDLAGHGDSGNTRGEYTIRGFARDIQTVMDHLKIEKAVLVGHSMGGEVCLEATRVMPARVACVVGVDTFQDLTNRFTDQYKAFMDLLKRDFEGAVRATVQPSISSNADKALVDKIVGEMLTAPEPMAVNAMRHLAAYDLQAVVSEMTMPLWSINADHYATNTAGNRTLNHRYNVKLVRGAGHFVMMEEPDAFNRCLVEIMEELASKAHG